MGGKMLPLTSHENGKKATRLEKLFDE